jgi:Na+/glutamate symporter
MRAVVTVSFILFALFPLLGRDYQAAVLSAGVTGLSLGATPTAITSMTAVTKPLNEIIDIVDIGIEPPGSRMTLDVKPASGSTNSNMGASYQNRSPLGECFV